MISSTANQSTTSFTKDGKNTIIHTLLADGTTEQIEEFDTKSNLLLTRKLRKKTLIGKEGPWIYEVGQEPASEVKIKTFMDEISESAGAPQVSRLDTLKEFVFRIRNLVYPLDVYNVTAEGDKIVVRTSNKKYFARLSITDLDRINQKTLEQASLSIDHKSDTLIISYKKPQKILENEEKERKARQQDAAKLNKPSNTATDKINKINDECKTQ
ncbi:UNVERIFIED_CONTAM: hypothetical protein HDU68_006767 [Siphonaria sp. JEL0065]|nr:hypothetical protein HDU68_006767 [Siphonaria sp. JEL0065]